ncbi:unnamed protein product [Arctogadus glacialis]
MRHSSNKQHIGPLRPEEVTTTPTRCIDSPYWHKRCVLWPTGPLPRLKSIERVTPVGSQQQANEMHCSGALLGRVTPVGSQQQANEMHCSGALLGSQQQANPEAHGLSPCGSQQE